MDTCRLNRCELEWAAARALLTSSYEDVGRSCGTLRPCLGDLPLRAGVLVREARLRFGGTALREATSILRSDPATLAVRVPLTPLRLFVPLTLAFERATTAFRRGMSLLAITEDSNARG